MQCERCGRLNRLGNGLCESCAESGPPGRRVVSVLFCDLVGSSALSQSVDAEDLRTILAQYHQVCVDAVNRYDGYTAQFLGDGVLIYFGYPKAHEDDARRAVTCALDILHGLAAADDRREVLVARLGIDTGRVVVGLVGSGASAESLALGEVPNFAARVQSFAAPGTLAISERTARLVRGFFVLESLGPRELKGFARSVELWRVKSQTMAHERVAAAAGALTPFAGRDHELDRLEVFAHSAAGRFAILDISGEAGIGKSRLLYEYRLRTKHSERAVLACACSSDRQQTPLAPFVDMLRLVLDADSADSHNELSSRVMNRLDLLGLSTDENTALLLHLLGVQGQHGALVNLDGVLIGIRVRSILLRLLTSLRQQFGVVLVIEDIHWIDSASQSFIAQIIAEPESSGLRIVTTRRPQFVPPWLAHASVDPLSLSPLDGVAMQTVVRANAGYDIDAPVCDRIIERCEGNPLFAEELAKSVATANAGATNTPQMQRTDRGAPLLPDSVSSLLAARVDALTPRDRDLLQFAAIVGRRFDLGLMHDIGPVTEDLSERLNGLSAAGLLRSDPDQASIEFKHALLHDVVYESILKSERKVLHLKVANYISQRYSGRLNEVAEILARHYVHTAESEKAVAALLLAGTKSLNVYALDEAHEHFERALQIAAAAGSSVDDHIVVQVLCAFSQCLNIRFENSKVKELVDLYRPLLERVGDSPYASITYSNFVCAACMRREYIDAAHAADRALEIATRLNDSRCKAYARSAWINAHMFLADKPGTELEQMKRLGMQDCDDCQDVYLHSWLRLNSAYDYMLRGQFDEVVQLARSMQSRGQRLSDPRVLSMSLFLEACVDLWEDRAAAALEKSIRCEATAITTYDLQVGRIVRGAAMLLTGQIPEAYALLRKVETDAASADFRYAEVTVVPALALALAFMGRFGESWNMIDRAIRHSESIGDRHSAANQRLRGAEMLIGMLQYKSAMPWRAKIKEFKAVVRLTLFGTRQARRWLLEAREDPNYREPGYYRARIDIDLGLLCAMINKKREAKERLASAQAIANGLTSEGLSSRIAQVTALV